MPVPIQAYRTRQPYNMQPPSSRTILVEYAFIPANLAGSTIEKRQFTEDTCIKVAMMNGWDKIIIGGYPHCTTVLDGVKIQCENHITATFGKRSGDHDGYFATHIHCNDLPPYKLQLTKDGRVNTTSTKVALGDRNVVHIFWVKAWVEKNKDTGMVERLRWYPINTPEHEAAKKQQLENAAKQKTKMLEQKRQLMDRRDWRTPTPPAVPMSARISSSFASGKMGQFVNPNQSRFLALAEQDKENKAVAADEDVDMK